MRNPWLRPSFLIPIVFMIASIALLMHGRKSTAYSWIVVPGAALRVGTLGTDQLLLKGMFLPGSDLRIDTVRSSGPPGPFGEKQLFIRWVNPDGLYISIRFLVTVFTSWTIGVVIWQFRKRKTDVAL